MTIPPHFLNIVVVKQPPASRQDLHYTTAYIQWQLFHGTFILTSPFSSFLFSFYLIDIDFMHLYFLNLIRRFCKQQKQQMKWNTRSGRIETSWTPIAEKSIFVTKMHLCWLMILMLSKGNPSKKWKWWWKIPHWGLTPQTSARLPAKTLREVRCQQTFSQSEGNIRGLYSEFITVSVSK